MAITRPIWGWRARDLRLEAFTGQAMTCTRAATAVATDLAGNTATLVNNQPRFQAVSGVVYYKGGAATTDYLESSLPIVPQALTFYLKFINRGAPGATMALACLSSANASLYLTKTTSNTYVLTHHNGTSSVTSTSSAVTSAQTIELRAVLRSTGVAQLYRSTNGAADVAATASGALALAAAWANANLRLASAVTGNSIDDDLIAAAVYLGEPTTAACRAIL